MPPKTIKLFLVDDHQLIRQAFTALIEKHTHLNIIDEAGNGIEMGQKLKRHLPDIILLDLEMPLMDGYDAAKFLRENYPQVKFIIVSTFYSQLMVEHFIQLGAHGVIPKNCDEKDLLNSIEAAFNRDTFYFVDFRPEDTTSCIKKDPSLTNCDLSERQIEILDLICQEKNNKQISQMLGISDNTVEFHRKNIYKKTNAHTLLGLYKYALKFGILSSENIIDQPQNK